MITRRDMLRLSAGGAALLVAPAAARAAEYTLPPLPYPADALEPHIDAETMTIHHDKHHKAYVDNLNKALTESAPALLGKPLDELMTSLGQVPEKARMLVRNNGGGHWNHTFFWSVMAKPGTGGAPKGAVLNAITDSFGSVDAMQKQFNDAAAKRFGSGWAWLVVGKEKPLAVVTSPNQDNPLMEGGAAPVLGVDVWEHAYYLKYRNLRPKYLEAWWNVVNWNAVAERFEKAKKG